MGGSVRLFILLSVLALTLPVRFCRAASNHTSSRAARSAAGTLFATEKYTEAIPFLEAALAINPLYSRSWFILGCAYVQVEDWKNAVRCFRRVVAVEDDDAEGWANLASCYLRMGDIGGEASPERQEAGTKCSRD